MRRTRSLPIRLPIRLGIALSLGLALTFAPLLPSFAARQGGGDAGSEQKTAAQKDVGLHATTLGRSDFEIVLVQYWSKGARFRSETIVAGHPIITLVNDGWYYTWDQLTGDGYAIKRGAAAVAADVGRSRPFGLELQELLDVGGENIRSESLNGVTVDVYRATEDGGRRTLWVDAEQLALPIRLESFDRESGRTSNLDWINWIPGLVIPDSFFEPPAGLSVTRFDSYAAYLDRLGKGPIPPVPPLFHYLLRDDGASNR